eukprot:m.217945 g.217945  ORF g.217945 m.217945 type:complete len:349 (+) comp17210_c0_seq3:3-1049(+)
MADSATQDASKPADTSTTTQPAVQPDTTASEANADATLPSEAVSYVDPWAHLNIPEYDEDGNKLTKRQRRAIKKDLIWEARAGERKEKRRQERQRRRAKRNAKAAELGPEAVIRRYTLMSDPKALPLRVCIDLDFEEYMGTKDRKKLAKQVRRCYAENRKLTQPLQYHLTSNTGLIKGELDRGHIDNCDIHSSAKHYTECFSKDDIVYLSSESENVLQDLDMSKVYVIGGLVDHNIHKGLSHARALGHGVQHARLPIAEYIELGSRHVLTVNHVFEILLQWTVHRNWEKAFFDVLPTRKEPAPKRSKDEADQIKAEKQRKVGSTHVGNDSHAEKPPSAFGSDWSCQLS